MDYVSTVCCLLAFLLYNNTLDSGFVYDDRRAILSNPDLLPKTPWSHLLENDFWGTPLTDSGSHGSYRPVCVLTFRLNYLLGGFQPWGYHLVNVLLHCLATALLVKVARQVFPRSKSLVGTAITGLLFAAHPVHTEAVAGIVGRADLAACNFYLLSFLAYIAHVRVRDSTCCHRSVPNDYDRQTNGHKYQRLMYGLKKNISNCNWSKQLGKNVAQCDVVSNNKSCSVGSRKSLTFLQDYFKSDIKTWFYLFMSVVLAGASMLSKETGITVMGVCCIYDLACARSTKKKQWSSFIILGVTSIILLMIRFHFQPGTPQFSTADNPTAKEPRLLTRLLTFLYLPVFNFWLLLAPVNLSFDWGMDAIPRITSVGDNRNIVTVIFYTVLIMSIKKTVLQIRKKRLQEKQTIARTKKFKEIFPESKGNRGCFCKVCHTISENHTITCRNSNNNNSVNSKCVCAVPKQPARVYRENRSRSTTILLSLAFLTLPFLPATNLFFYVGFVVAERVLYLPSVGVCLLLGLAGATLWTHRRYRSLLSVILLCVLTVFSARTVVRNSDWFDEEHLYRSAIAFNPPKAFGNLGSVLNSQGRLEEAEWAFRRALQYRPNMADVHYNLAILLQGKQQLDDAILSYQRAIHFRPSLALAYVNLGAALIAAGRCQEAVAVLRQCSRLDGTGLKDRREHETAKVSALLQLGALYSEQGRLQRALAAYREAAHSLPDHYPPQSVFNVVGETLARLHQDEEAERWYQAALNAQPDHVPAHITYGKLLAKNVSRAAEAEQWFRKAQRLAPDEPSVYHHYGEFLASRRRYREAAGMYERAAELQPEDYELAVAAATAMRQAGRHLEAERWYRKAVALKPTDARSHTNLGAILHLNGKYREAADSYKEALRLQPNDVTTLTNLHKLHSIMT